MYMKFSRSDTALFLENFKKKVTGDNKVTLEKKKLPEKVADDKDKDISVSLLKIQVGQIRKAWKHPSADRFNNSLFVQYLFVSLQPLIWRCTPKVLTA